jgi:diacylglycerol kinase
MISITFLYTVPVTLSGGNGLPKKHPHNMHESRLQKAFGYAFQGLVHFMRTDANGRIHFVIAVLVIAAGFLFHISSTEWILILLCTALVLSLEMMNHALEALCNRVEPDHDPLIKTAKDVAAAAVLWSAIISVVIGLIIFIPYLMKQFT